MSIIAGYDSAHAFRLVAQTLPDTATFTAQARKSLRGHPRGFSGPVIAELTTGGGSIVLTEDLDGSPIITLIFGADDTAEWDAPEVVVDIVRTDLVAPEYLGFKLIFDVEYPVTVLP